MFKSEFNFIHAKNLLFKLSQYTYTILFHKYWHCDCFVPDCGVATSDSILTPEQALLAKLEEENRRIEADAKCPSLTTVHSRKSSDTSQISLASGKVDKKMLTFSNAKPRQVFPTMRCIFLLKHAKSCWQLFCEPV